MENKLCYIEKSPNSKTPKHGDFIVPQIIDCVNREYEDGDK